MNDAQKNKIQDFYEKLKKIQPAKGYDIGLLVTSDNLGDISAALPDSNNISVYELLKSEPLEKIIKGILNDLKSGRNILLRLHDYLDPSVYNQLFLIARSGRTDYFLPEGSITFNVPKSAVLLIVISTQELENLNYKDFLNVCGPVLRLDN